jgi:glycosyltransferase involved in cell wall biosynthesis
MRILYFVYARQKSFRAFSESNRTGFSWIDSLLDEFVKHQENIIGLALPLADGTFTRATKGNITLYGLSERKSGGKVGRLISRIRHRESMTDLVNSALKAIEDFNPDVIQLFGTENPLGGIIPLTNKPVVIHFQGSLDVVAEKWFSGISKHDIVKYGSLRNFVLFRGPYHEYFTFKKKAARENRIIHDCNYFIGRTDFDRRLLALVSPGSGYFHCEEFIRPQFFLSRWNRQTGKKVCFISILKGVTYKGLDVLLETSAVIDKYFPFDYEFKICGIGDHEEIVSIMRRKYRNQVDFSKFVFLGKVDTASLVTQICDADIFIHPSYIENSSNSICEAMALGIPVIATNVGGTPSLMENGREGLLVQEGEPLSMAAAILALMADPDKARLLGTNARERAVSRHNTEALYSRLMWIYNEIKDTARAGI